MTDASDYLLKLANATATPQEREEFAKARMRTRDEARREARTEEIRKSLAAPVPVPTTPAPAGQPRTDAAYNHERVEKARLARETAELERDLVRTQLEAAKRKVEILDATLAEGGLSTTINFNKSSGVKAARVQEREPEVDEELRALEIEESRAAAERDRAAARESDARAAEALAKARPQTKIDVTEDGSAHVVSTEDPVRQYLDSLPERGETVWSDTEKAHVPKSGATEWANPHAGNPNGWHVSADAVDHVRALTGSTSESGSPEPARKGLAQQVKERFGR